MICTARLMLRRARQDDLTALHAVFSHPQTIRYWSCPEHETRDETARLLDGLLAPDEDSVDFVVDLQGTAIGKAGAWRLPEVGFIPHPDHRGRGLGHEATVAVIAHVQPAWPDLPALTAEVKPRSTASLRLLGRLGFAETDRAARTLLWRDEWCDNVYLTRPRGDISA